MYICMCTHMYVRGDGSPEACPPPTDTGLIQAA